ncbi:MAG: PEGA domain-containing protein [Candidatus Doudnabacteria bacterium]|nr:PEGA domain-containing protein [Candidatus Doudnabacteria bacterium]
MRLRNRLLIVALGVIIFLIVTPILILFARGFKVDTKNWQIVKTGILVAKTEPDEASVFIENKLQKKLTPATIRFLLPSDYNIRIEKEGYLSWTKRLPIKSQFVTWATANREFIALFLEHPELQPQSAIPENKTTAVSEGLVQADNLKFVLKDSILYRENLSLEKVYEPVTEAYWDDEAKKLVLSNNNEMLLLEPLSESPDLILRSISELKNTKLNWHTGYMFFQNEGKIKAVELDGRDHRNIYTLMDAMDDFLVSKDGKTLYVLNQQETKIYVIR